MLKIRQSKECEGKEAALEKRADGDEEFLRRDLREDDWNCSYYYFLLSFILKDL
jgi:hypothetical protein